MRAAAAVAATACWARCRASLLLEAAADSAADTRACRRGGVSSVYRPREIRCPLSLLMMRTSAAETLPPTATTLGRNDGV